MSDTPRTGAEQDNSETLDEAFNFGRQLERELAKAVAKERERCAKVSEEYPGDLHTRQDQWLANDIAAAIRKGE